MKLTDHQIAQIKEQMGAEPVAADDPAAEVLTDHFGEHTFYVDEAGLHIFETEQTELKTGPCSAHPVKVASWTNEDREALSIHDPVLSGKAVTIDIEE